MKKLMVLAVLLAAMVVGSWSTVAIAGSAYSNARADFWVYQTAPEDARAFAIINYDKEEQNWKVTLQVHDLLPNTDYYFSVGTEKTAVGNTVITTFTTDGEGRASWHGVVDNLPEEYNIARIYQTPVQTELTAPESDGSLKFRGERRGQ